MTKEIQNLPSVTTLDGDSRLIVDYTAYRGTGNNPAGITVANFVANPLYINVTATSPVPDSGILRGTLPDVYNFYGNSENDLALSAGGIINAVVRNNMWLSQDNGPTTNRVVLGGGSSLPAAIEGSVVITGESDTASSTTLRVTSAGLVSSVHLVQKVKGTGQDPTEPDNPDNSIIHFTAGGVLTGNEVYNGSLFTLAAFDGADALLSVQRRDNTYNPGLKLYTVGAGSFTFQSDNTATNLLKLERVASGVNFLVLSPGTTGNPTLIEVRGSDVNSGISMVLKGTGIFSAGNINITNSNIPTNGLYLSSAGNLGIVANSARQVRVNGTVSAVNHVYLTGGATGNSPLITAAGSDTNVNLTIGSQGTNSTITFTTNIFTSAATQAKILHQTGATDYLTIRGGTGETVISVDGTTTNSNIEYAAKGTGIHLFENDSGSILELANVASTVNYIGVFGGATGNAPQIYATGANANIDLQLTPQGTGLVKFGVKTGTGDVAIDGYVSIKTAAGATIKLATVA